MKNKNNCSLLVKNMSIYKSSHFCQVLNIAKEIIKKGV